MLIARKLLVYFFDTKTMNNLLHRMIFGIRFFDQAKYLGVLVNASLNDEDDIQRQVKLLHCAVNKLRGSGVTDR